MMKIFMWFLVQKDIFTKYDLAKQNWICCKKSALLVIPFLLVPLNVLFEELFTLPLILPQCYQYVW
jgi:hypothetical protein